MDEVQRFCVRILGEGPEAAAACESAAAESDRLSGLRAALAACREGEDEPAVGAAPSPGGGDLAGAVAAELAAAAAQLPRRQREVLALGDLLRLRHAEIAEVLQIGPEEVARLLARARLGLRAALRGSEIPPADCPEHERTLRTAVLRRDGEEVPAADEDWLIEHVGHCAGCRQAHAAMLEASTCYRAWPEP